MKAFFANANAKIPHIRLLNEETTLMLKLTGEKKREIQREMMDNITLFEDTE